MRRMVRSEASGRRERAASSERAVGRSRRKAGLVGMEDIV